MVQVHFIDSEGARHDVEMEAGYSLMEAALEGNVPGILAECGGGMVCATCHVHVAAEWLDRAGRAGDIEEMILEGLHDHLEASRLSCQVRLTEELNGLVVSVPPSR